MVVPEALLEHHPGKTAAGVDAQVGAQERKRAAVGRDEQSPGRRSGLERDGLDRRSLSHGQASFQLTRPTQEPVRS